MSLKWALLGSSRGLGAEFRKLLQTAAPAAEILQFSRKPAPGLWQAADFSKNDDQDKVLEALAAFAPDHVVYFAGGGPYGPFAKPAWKDHRWSLEVTFLFAARLTHFLCGASKPPQTLTWIGSSIAEENGEAKAGSYAAAKAALRAMFESLAKEKSPVELRLFSPGYMDTGLLPAHAEPRRWSAHLWQPSEVARELYHFIRNVPAPARRRLTPYRYSSLVKGQHEQQQ